MKAKQLATLKFFSLLFLLPGLAGLIISAIISTNYLDTLPKSPTMNELRTVPREINGAVVYQTAQENRRLNIIEYSSVGVFILGLGLGLVYLEQWGSAQASAAEQEDKLTHNLG